jgi:hypothetical protein
MHAATRCGLLRIRESTPSSGVQLYSSALWAVPKPTSVNDMCTLRTDRDSESLQPNKKSCPQPQFRPHRRMQSAPLPAGGRVGSLSALAHAIFSSHLAARESLVWSWSSKRSDREKENGGRVRVGFATVGSVFPSAVRHRAENWKAALGDVAVMGGRVPRSLLTTGVAVAVGVWTCGGDWRRRGYYNQFRCARCRPPRPIRTGAIQRRLQIQSHPFLSFLHPFLPSRSLLK